MKIAMLEPIAVSQELLNQLAAPLEAAGHEVLFCTAPLTADEKAARAKDAEVLIVANSPLSAEFISNCDAARLISVAFTGVDHLPKEVCVAKGITVCNAQGYATIAVRDLVFGFVFGLMRNLVPCNDVVRQGGTKDGLVGNEIAGKTFGIIGYGQIGQAVAQVAKVLGCRVLAHSRSTTPGTSDDTANFVDLDELLTQSDIISLHTPLTSQTKGMIGAEQLAKMKNTAILINAARGPVVDSAALADALNTGQIAAAGIDVFDIEPPLNLDEPLLTTKNTMLAPHIGFATKESMVKRAKIVFDNVEKWLADNPQNVQF
ncbi:MAG: hydroxyacid dehydrogenase [Defluviitaleaceae bacterium]|nr:hydroxyacid dehydrogenase [Defluviitaleaceae bacterium]